MTETEVSSLSFGTLSLLFPTTAPVLSSFPSGTTRNIQAGGKLQFPSVCVPSQLTLDFQLLHIQLHGHI